MVRRLSENSPVKSIGPGAGNVQTPRIIVGDVKRKEDSCRLCGLLSRAVRRYSSGNVNDMTMLFLTWEIDGRKVAENHQHVNLTRRLRVRWTEVAGVTQDVYLVLVAPKSSRQINSDAYAAFGKNTHFLGRGLIELNEKQSLIKSWIDICVKGHGNDTSACHTTHGSAKDFKDLIKGTHFGVIDVVDMCLKELPLDSNGNPERYVALSYVWGKRPSGEEVYKTVMSNVLLHIRHGGIEKIWNQLPRTIQHAILLVSRLGERYIWVDSLCIVQDSVSSWELNARAMHLVYGNAHLTICAADGDAETGLLAVEPMLQPMSPIHLAHLDTVADKSAEKPRQPLTAHCAPGVTVLLTRSPEAIIQDSSWNKRGWTFQERLLSRRCLLFAEGQVYFQCRTSVMSQDVFTDGGRGGWSLDLTNVPLRTLRELDRRAFWFYMRCVQLYTGRDLSQPKDILMEFQGTSWLLQQRFNSPLLYGLPTSHFDIALLWSPMDALRRRKKQRRHHLNTSICSQDEFGNCTCKPEEEDYGKKDFPSWSWCGWIGGKAEYQSDMIEACLLNVREWLTDHTWISWHFRDQEGNLRPLWDKSSVQDDVSDEVQWRGYKGRPAARAVDHGADMSKPKPENDLVIVNGSKRGGIKFSGSSREHTRGTKVKFAPRAKAERKGGTPVSSRRRPAVRPGLLEDDDDRWYRTDNTKYIQNSSGETSSYSASLSAYPPPVPQAQYYYPPPFGNSPYAHAGNNPFRPVGPADYYPYPAPGPYAYPQPAGMYHAPPQPLANVATPVARQRQPHLTYTYSSDGTESLSDTDSWASAQETISDDDEVYLESASLKGAADREIQHGGDGNTTNTSSVSSLDPYGRPRRHLDKFGIPFSKIIPDNPFGTIREPFSKDQQKHDYANAMPILQFFTWQTWLFVRRAETTGPSVLGTKPSLSRHDIIDKAGDWCGSIMLPDDGNNAALQDASQSFIAISDAKAFTREECPIWNYYIPKERDESDWDLYYVLLLRRDSDRGLWERVALGKVFKAAFSPLVANWEEIKLG
ncbi:hypothetical protein N0V93_008321 [Gnomoniopsis smithogilvyi]|uniref:Heterokaryon incompatibility domain-containing protein n=1 Tax=Gnomoniopsis smithogilvyi TaxID=1191159 RepID=A0A9W9CUN1_9PEZI|nr:hypothetical protein N0V93_008321 [Gnomoniopsis smithogilvyi]